MPSERHKITPSVYMVLVRDGKILLARRANTGFMDGMYSFPAGHLEGSETLKQGAIREAKEEVGVDVEPNDAQLVHVVSRLGHDGERVGFFFRTEKWSGEPKIMEPDKCDDVAWFAVDAVPENTVDYVKEAIKLFSKGETYSEFGWK